MERNIRPIGAMPNHTVVVGYGHHPAAVRPLFDRVGGRPTLERVHAALYRRIYADPVLSQFFNGIPRDRQEKQLTDFMSGALGGPKQFVGKHPRQAHSHLFITIEMFDTRHHYLAQALVEAHVPTLLHDEWLRIDRAFGRILTKRSVAECQPRFGGDPIIVAK